MFRSGNRVDPEWLAEIEFFSAFDRSGLEAAAKLGTRRDVAAGERVIDQGRFGDACYVISSGQANVYISGDYVNTVGAGSVIGEMALIAHRPRAATVVADTEMVLVSFGIDEFKALLDENPAAQQQVLDVLNRRARDNAERD